MRAARFVSLFSPSDRAGVGQSGGSETLSHQGKSKTPAM
tara:strand:- start:70 stop:186 length:117 start_codon:yes stop_codon:yes gene_type:complete